MAQNHRGNVQPSLDAEEHATVSGVDGKKVFVIDTAGNVVNSFGGGSQATVTPLQAWPDPQAYIGLVTATGNFSLGGNATLNPSPNQIGSVTISHPISIAGNLTLSDPKGYIGLVSVAQPLSTTFSGNVTLDPGSKTQIAGNVTLSDPKGYIGLVTVGNRVDLNSNVTLSPSPNFIGIVTVTNQQPLVSGAAYVGLATIDIGSNNNVALKGNITLSDSKGFIGLTTTTLGDSLANIGFATVAVSTPTIFAVVNTTASSGLATVDIRNTINANVSLGASEQFIGLVTIANTVALRSNVTLNPSINWVGFATVAIGSGGAGDGAILDGADATIKASVTSIADGRYLHIGIKSNSTVLLGNMPALTTGAAYVGLVTVANTVPVTFSGNVTLDVGSLVGIRGNVTLSDSKGYIGLVTNTQTNAILAGTNYIGLATIDIGSNNNVAIKGNVTLSDPKASIGLVTLNPSSAYIGLVTSTHVGLVTTVNVGLQTLAPSPNYIGLASVNIGGGNVGLNAGVNNIGFATVNQVNQPALIDSSAFIGIVTVANTIPVTFAGNVTLDDGSLTGIAGNVTLSDSKGFIGLVTAITRNAGTNKSLVGIPLFLSTSSQATLAVPATNLSIFVTSLLINSDATVRVSIKSGVTYLTGNASIGVTLNPGGGWVEIGSPDAPVYISTPSASINVEKFDMTSTKANIGGKLVYFSE